MIAIILRMFLAGPVVLVSCRIHRPVDGKQLRKPTRIGLWQLPYSRLDSKARAARISAEISRRRAISSAV
jgi:hypothetical protein